jgi:hypothetical protein
MIGHQTRISKKVILLLLALVGLFFLPPSVQSEERSKAGSVRVYRFDNLDIDGHVKTPHLMYFLKRIRNRFRAFRLPDQSFIKKTIETKNADFL